MKYIDMLKSIKNMANTSKIPIEFGVLAIIFVAFFLVSFFTPNNSEASIKKQEVYFSSFNEGAYGLSKLTKAAEMMEIPVYHNLSHIEKIPDNIGVIFSISPEVPYKDSEMSALGDYLYKGGILIFANNIIPMLEIEKSIYYFESKPYPLFFSYPEALRKEVDGKEEQTTYTTSSGKFSIKTISDLPNRLHPIFKNVSKIQYPLFKYEDKLHHIVYSPIIYIKYIYIESNNVMSISDHLYSNYFPKEYWTPIPDYSKIDHRKEENSEFTISLPYTILAYEDNDPSIIYSQVGEGYVISIANPTILSNGFLGADDNLQFALNLLELTPEGKGCMFDEFHHGLRKSANGNYWFETGWGRMLLALCVIGLLGVISRAVRFIPPIGMPMPDRRSQMEYLRSMALILRKAQAVKTVGKIVTRDITHDQTKDRNIFEMKKAISEEISSGKPSETKLYGYISSLMMLCKTRYWKKSRVAKIQQDLRSDQQNETEKEQQ